MLKGGEDPVFIARRMLIAASEDIGNSNPNALLLAGECFPFGTGCWACRSVVLFSVNVQCIWPPVPKVTVPYLAINKALDLAEKTANLPVPLHLRNAPTKLMKEQGYGVDYSLSAQLSRAFRSARVYAT